MPPPPTIPPPPTRRPQRRPAPAPEPQYDDVAGDEIVIDDPSALPRGGTARPNRGGEYDFLPEEPRQQRPQRNTRQPQRPPQDTWDDDYGYDDEPPPSDRRR